MIREYCACPKHRLLAEYEQGATTIERLAPKAGIVFEFAIPRVPQGPYAASPRTGSATCERLTCKLLRRN